MGLYNVKFRYSNFKIIINYNLYDVEIEEFPRNTILSDLEQGMLYVGIIQIITHSRFQYGCPSIRMGIERRPWVGEPGPMSM